MTRNETQRFTQQTETGRNAMPGRGAGRMRQRNQIEGAAFIANLKRAADDFVQFFKGKKLRDSEFADGNQKFGLEQIDFVIHPGRAVTDFVRRRNPIAASRRFPRETATNRGEINFGANLVFAHRAKFAKPSEERPACSPREWFPEHGFLY